MKSLLVADNRDWGKWGDVARPIAFGGMVLAASLLNFLSAEQYPILTVEVGILAAALVGVAVVMGLLYAVSHRLVRALLEILLLLFALDLNFDGWYVLIGTAVIAVALNQNLLVFLGITASIVMLLELPSATYLRPRHLSLSNPPSLASGDTSLPPLVHIILDEHIGIEGLTAAEITRATGAELRAFYLDQGFYISGGAYSDSLHTVNSIPSLLNFGQEQTSNKVRKTKTVAANRYFDDLRKRGYAINVHQTNYLDLCTDSGVSRCWTNPRSLLLALQSIQISPTDKAVVLGLKFFALSVLANGAGKLADDGLGLGLNLNHLGLPFPLPAIETLELVEDQVRQRSRGSAIFVHVLAPHRPYIFDRSCTLKPISDWSFDSQNPSRFGVQAAYQDQVKCLLTKLKPIFDAAGDGTIIVVHGDHGSRNGRVNPWAEEIGKFSDNDLIVSFSTLYAVRGPGIPSEYDRRPLPIGLLLRQLVESDFRIANPTIQNPPSASVTLDNAGRTPIVRYPLPPTWPAP